MVILHTVLDHGCQLLPTLQTWAGMVLDCGNARQRASAKETSFFNANEAEILANAAHVLQQLPFTPSDFDERHRQILVENLWACTAQATVTRSSLLEYIKHRKRLDVEQAVAMVLAFIPAEVGSKLTPLVSDMFYSSRMWRTSDDFEFENTKTLDAARERRMTRLRDIIVAMAKVEPVDDNLHLIHVLMRVRRERSALSSSQRLCFPKCLITLVPEDERNVWSESYASGKQTDVKIDCESVINVTKTQFARMQRWLSRLDGDNREKAMFIREVREFEKEVCWANSQIKVLEKTEDPAALAFSFMAVQRRLQLKVVSDEAWTGFLKKEQGRGLLQNRPEIVTSFEEELARHATDVPALTAIRPPTSLSMQCSVESLIDKVCILMEQYVLVFGNGRFENLRYLRFREERWKGRGPEDVYNLLVDLLAMLRERGDGRFRVGPCHKFLAKDIMAWNNAWADDAFAPGKTPGWVDWLQERQKLRIQLDAPGVSPPSPSGWLEMLLQSEQVHALLVNTVTGAVRVGLENISPVVRKATRNGHCNVMNAAFARLQPPLEIHFRCPVSA